MKVHPTLVHGLVPAFDVVQDQPSRILFAPKEGPAAQNLVVRPMPGLFMGLAPGVVPANGVKILA